MLTLSKKDILDTLEIVTAVLKVVFWACLVVVIASGTAEVGDEDE